MGTGGGSTLIGTDSIFVESPALFPQLGEPYPNPFNPRVSIPFTLDRGRPIRLSVYDLLGRKVAQLKDGPSLPGDSEIDWIGLDDRGDPLPSGTYIVRLSTGDFSMARKLVLIR